MKKVVKKIIILFIIILAVQTLILIFKTHHEVEYKIKDGKSTYEVKEIFKDKKYHYIVKWDKKEFSFFVDNNYHKSKKVLKDMESFKENNLSCIYPDLEEANIICYKNDEKLSYEIVKDEVKPFVETLKKLGYENNSWNKEEEKNKTLGQLTINENVIDKDTYIYIWNYKGFYSINKKEQKNLKIFENDTYKNDLGIRVNNYYIIPDYDQKYDFDKMFVYNMKNNKKKVIKLKEEISRDSYFLGVVEDYAYLFDKDALKEYKINPKKRKISLVGDKKKKGLFYNGTEFEERNIYDFKQDEELLFKTDTTYLKEVEDKTSLKYIFKIDNIYYYYDKDNNFYQYDPSINKKILLFNKKVTDLYVVDHDIYFIEGNNLYQYKKNEKIRKLLNYEEFNFNSLNRIAIYKK